MWFWIAVFYWWVPIALVWAFWPEKKRVPLRQDQIFDKTTQQAWDDFGKASIEFCKAIKELTLKQNG